MQTALPLYQPCPSQCKPSYRTKYRIILFIVKNITNYVNLANNFVSNLNNLGLGTKNVPDAIEWHFAAYWNHMYSYFGVTETEFKLFLRVIHVR